MVSGDEEVKLLLEAFQMSVSACLSHPQTPVLRAQMLGRLMAVNLSASVKVCDPPSASTPSPAHGTIPSPPPEWSALHKGKLTCEGAAAMYANLCQYGVP